MKVFILLIMLFSASIAVDGGVGLVIGYTISIVGGFLLGVITQTILIQMLLSHNKRESQTFWTLFWHVFFIFVIVATFGYNIGQIVSNSISFSLFVFFISIFLVGIVSKFIKDKEGKAIGFIVGILSTIGSMVSITTIVLSFSMRS